MRKIKRMLKDRRGDVYIPLLISLCILAVAMVVAVSIGSAMNTKMWLDEKLNDMARIVSANGAIQTEQLTNIENEIIDRLGGQITYEGDFLIPDVMNGYTPFSGSIAASDSRDIRIQLNDVVYIHYTNNAYAAISVGEFTIDSDIDLRTMGVSNVYYKAVRGMTD